MTDAALVDDNMPPLDDAFDDALGEEAVLPKTIEDSAPLQIGNAGMANWQKIRNPLKPKRPHLKTMIMMNLRLTLQV